MALKVDGTNGLLQAYDYQIPTSGSSYNFPAGTQVLVMNPAGTLATFSITFPSTTADGMIITFSSSQQITALTLNGNTGQTVVGAVTFLPAKTGVSYIFRDFNKTWYPTATVPGTGSQLVSGTSQASTSGTSIDFTGIPSWVKRITVMFNGVSTNGTSNFYVQIGTSSGVETTGYVSGVGSSTSGSAASYSSATSAFILGGINTAADTQNGAIVLVNVSGNTWAEMGVINRSSGGVSAVGSSAGVKTLAATLDRVRITSATPDTFDAGSINILYE